MAEKVTTAGVARILGVAPRTVGRYAAEGFPLGAGIKAERLPSTVEGGELRFEESVVREWAKGVGLLSRDVGES